MARFLGIFLKMVWGFSRRTLRNARGEINDTYRIEFVTDHLKELQRAIEAGAPCFGYHMWTFIDCWSWLNAYKIVMGIIE